MSLARPAGVGIVPAAIVQISSDVTLAHNTVNYVNTSAARLLTLPSPVAGTTITLKDKSGQASTNNVTVARFGSEKIENVAASKILQTDFFSVTLISDGTDWWIF